MLNVSSEHSFKGRIVVKHFSGAKVDNMKNNTRNLPKKNHPLK